MFAPRGWLKRPVPRMIYRTLQQSDFFDPKWYRLTQLSGLERTMDPLWHYLDHGWKKGLNPSRFFDTNYYLKTNHDVQELGLNPLFHYLKYGVVEQRHPVQTSLQELNFLRGPTAPLTLISTPEGLPPRLSVVLDDYTPRDSGVPYLRVLLLAIALAEQAGARLRILDRRTLCDNLGIEDTINVGNFSLPKGFEYRAVGIRNENQDLPAYPNEKFLATSWSSAGSLLRSIPDHNLLYLKSDNELRLYGDSDRGAAAKSTIEMMSQSTISLDSEDPPSSKKPTKHNNTALQWSPSWQQKTPEKKPSNRRRKKIVVDLDLRATGQRVELTLESLTTALGSGLLDENLHELVVLSDSPSPRSVLGSTTPRVVAVSGIPDLVDLAAECDVLITLARPDSCGVVERAVLARGGAVVSRHRSQLPDLKNIFSVEPHVDGVVSGIQQALSLDVVAKKYSNLTFAVKAPG